MIACFDDTGLEAARCAANGPVIGIGEAAFHLASLIAHRFSVVTTLSRSIAPIETNLMKYGLDRRCARVRACEVPVLALEDPASGARGKLSAEIERAKAEEGAEAIVLGCAGMAELAASLAREHGLPVVDGVAAAVKLAEVAGRSGACDLEARVLCAAVAEAVYRGVRGDGERVSGPKSGPFGFPSPARGRRWRHRESKDAHLSTGYRAG